MKSKIIILSIHPHHIKKILSGQKRYEYRKRIPLDIQYIIVYASAPIKEIVALIEVESILTGTPKEIWIQTKDYSGISKKFFMDYFRNKQTSYAIKFKAIHKLPVPKSITELDGVAYAPQAYKYIHVSISKLQNELNVSL